MKITFGVVFLALTTAIMINFKTVKNLFSDKKEIQVKPKSVETKGSFHDFTVKSLDGKEIKLSSYKGKKVVVINVASKCGYTPQYADWQAFHKQYGKDIVVLGFPANDFMKQEPGTNEEIATFCQKNYGVDFQMFEKINVTGDEQHPLYQWLSKKDLNGWNDAAPTWNFCKYVINENGEVTHFFASKIKPNDAEFKAAVGI